MRSDEVVNSPQVNKERTFVSGKLMHSVQKYILQLFFSFRLVPNLFLIFHQISASRSYEKSVHDTA